MTHFTSGKRGHLLYREPTSYQFDRETLMKILRREDDLRLRDPEMQKLYTECGDDTDKIAEITNYIQEVVLLENGVQQRDMPEALRALRNMRIDYENDFEVLNLAIYHRVDKCFEGDLTMGCTLDQTYDSKLIGLDGKETSLFSYYKEVDPELTKPFVIFSGSIT